MNNIKTDAPCPSCRSVGGDSTGNHLMVFNDGGKFCNRCNFTVDTNGKIGNPGRLSYNIGDTYEDSEPSVTDDTEETTPTPSIETVGIDGLSPMKYRGIPVSVRSGYGVKDTATHHYYPRYSSGSLVTYKVREEPKNFYSMKSTKGTDLELFGQHTYKGERTVLITEGEEDAMAAHYMLQGYSGTVCCVSLPDGANTKAITNNLLFLKKAGKIVVCPDQDTVGKRLPKAIAKILPTIHVMSMSEKDACDMLAKGKKKEFVNDFFRAEPYRPSSIILAEEVRDQAVAPVQWGLSYPWDALTKATYGLRTQQVIGLGGGPGSGKTTLIQDIENHIVDAHKQKIAVFSLEETPAFSLKKLVGAKLNLPIHLPDTAYDEAEVHSVIDDINNMVYFYDHSGYKDFDDIEEAITALALQDVKYFFIDPLSALTAHLTASETNDYLNRAMLRMTSLTQCHDITIFHVNHLNNPQGAKDHGEGAKVRAGQFSGSRSMWKFSTDMWGMSRNQLAEDEEQKHEVEVQILKNRLSGKTTAFPLRFNPQTGRLEEPHKGSGFTAIS